MSKPTRAFKVVDQSQIKPFSDVLMRVKGLERDPSALIKSVRDAGRCNVTWSRCARSG